jgi:hypothetical protein
MKTPMQEMLEWVRATLSMDLETPRMIEEKIESMLEKEKEVIMDAFLEGKLDGWQNQWADPNDYYNQTFNTKEK